MARDLVYPVLRCVLWIHRHLRWDRDVSQVRAYISELRFLGASLCWFARYVEDGRGDENMENLKTMLFTIGSMFQILQGVFAETMDEFKKGKNFRREKERRLKEIVTKEEVVLIYEIDFERYFAEEQPGDVPEINAKEATQLWTRWNSYIGETIDECKLQIAGYCPILLLCTFKDRFAPSNYQTLRFLDVILKYFKVRCLAGEAKERIQNLEEKRSLLHAFFKLIHYDRITELNDFRGGLCNDINKLAWLTFFFSAKTGDEEIAAELNLVLSDMSRKIIKPPVPDVASWYFQVLKAMQLQRSSDDFFLERVVPLQRSANGLLLGQVVPGFLDLLFECLGVPLHEDFQILRDWLIILYTFLANPPYWWKEDEELFLIHDQIGDLLRQGSHLIPPVDVTNIECAKEEVHLSNFSTTIERLKGKIRKVHKRMPNSFSCNFPTTNGLGFIDFLLQNLKENLNGYMMFIPFAKHLITKIEQELASLRPDLDEIFELQKEQKELQDTWLQLINLAYLTEHTVNSCSITLHPIWYNMVRLADILDEIVIIKGKIDSSKHSKSYNAAILPNSVRPKNEMTTQAWSSVANEIMVGLEEEVDTIVEQLTRGSKSLEIVSIVGMGGSGKTTLAKKAYDAKQVRSHFHIFASCTVSQDYSTRKLLLQILKDINGAFVDDGSMTDDDLAHVLHKKLSGKSYLVLMDDIWRIDAWEKVRSSFPNEKEGSRVIFTTRESEVAKSAQTRFSPHSKKFLSDKQSWELLQLTAFHQIGCPLNLSDSGKAIAKNCRGLPLAVTLIGRLLARKERSLTLWNDIAEKTTAFASAEGCTKVLELSYKHLPEHLKSCFLYLGIFAEDEKFPAKRLMNQWIAEGFVQRPHRGSTEIVANEYLNELVDRNLVQVATRSSNNGIKACHLHDVIRDFCQRKAQEENNFQQVHTIKDCNSSNSNRYRFIINMSWDSFIHAKFKDPCLKSLLYFDEKLYDYKYDGTTPDFLRFPLIQVLDLENIIVLWQQKEVDRLIEHMTSLVHLRYLAVPIDGGDIEIPSWIADLKNLETFILRCGKGALGQVWWSETFWRMESLRYVDAGRFHLIPCPSEFEAYPPLYKLECFSTLVLKPETATTILKRLPNVRKLSCVIDIYSANHWVLALDLLNKLEILKLRLNQWVLAFGQPVDLIFPATLKKSSLYVHRLPSQLGQLPCLEVLKIHGYSEKRWDVEDGEFPELKFLKVESHDMIEWNAEDGSFPRLESLVLVNCQKLLELPASFRESTTLKKIEIRTCSLSVATSAREIRDEQNDLGNEIQLIITDGWGNIF